MSVRHLPELMTDLKNEIHRDGSPDFVIVSSESLQNFVWSDRLPNLKLLIDMFDETHVICALRRQDLLLESIFKQHVKDPVQRCAEPIAEFFDRRTTWFRYDRLLMNWANLVGFNHLHPFPYRNDEKNINLNTFSNIVTKITGKKVQLQNPLECNISLNGAGLEIKWALNKTTVNLNENRKLLQFVLQKQECREPIRLLDENQRLRILNDKFNSNVWLIEKFNRTDWAYLFHCSPEGRMFDSSKAKKILELQEQFHIWCANDRVSSSAEG